MSHPLKLPSWHSAADGGQRPRFGPRSLINARPLLRIGNSDETIIFPLLRYSCSTMNECTFRGAPCFNDGLRAASWENFNTLGIKFQRESWEFCKLCSFANLMNGAKPTPSRPAEPDADICLLLLC